MRYILSLLAISTLTFASEIRTMPVTPTPESSTVVLAVSMPRKGQVMNNYVPVKFRIDGYALGASSPSERAEEIAVSDMGQTVHVVVDNNPYFPIIGEPIDPFNENGSFWDTTYRFVLPYALDEGFHLMRFFPARSFGESLKGENTFVAVPFYIGAATDEWFDLRSPFLTYNEPSNQMYLQEGKPVLLDFYVTNADLDTDGYKVRLMIDGQVNRILHSWQPYYIYGLPQGKHSIRLQLLDPKNQVVSGPYNDVEQIIFIN